MESLPALPLHQLELKTPLDVPQFSKLAECLQTGDVNHDEAVNKASEELANLRKEIINPSMDTQGIERLHKYFGQLHLISLRVEMDQKGQPAFIKFKWNDTNYFGKISGSINVEKFFLLFNIAAIHSHLANEALKKGTDEDLKKSCKHLQCASGVFMWIKQNMADVNKVDKTIVQDETVDFHYQVLLVHAQEQLLYKAIKDKRKNNLLAKLCQHVFESYQIMFDDIQQEDIGDFGLKKHPDWYEFTYCRMSFYACLTWLLNGLNYDEQSEYGNALYCYEKAVVFADGFPRTSKSKVTETSTATDHLKNFAKQKAETSKRDNSFIFHEKVPESLPDVVGQCLVKAISFTAYDATIVGQDLFPTTISIEAVSATSVYSEKKDSLLRELTSEVESSNEELTQFEGSLDLGSLKYMDAIPIDNKPLPQELVERVAKLSLKPKTAEEIENELQTLNKIVFGIDEKLSQISEKLDSEGRKNAQLQSEWGITRDASKFDEIAIQYEECRSEHHQSANKLKQLKEIIGLHVENLKLMSSMSIPELKIQLIAPDDDEALDEQSFELADQLKPMEKIKRLIDKIKEMKAQREKFLEQLKNEMDADDITVQLSATKDSNHEAIFEEELKKHEKTVGLMRQNLSAQTNICSAVEEAYAEYAVAKRKLDEMNRRREDRVEELVLSFDSCFQLRQKLQEFLDFYSDLSSKVSALREKLLDLSQLEEETRERIITARKNKPERPTAKKPNLMPSSPTVTRPDPAVVKPNTVKDPDLSSMLDPEFLKTLTPEERQLIETLSPEELKQLQMGVAPTSAASAPPQPLSPTHNALTHTNFGANMPSESVASNKIPASMSYNQGLPDNIGSGGAQGNPMLDALSEDEKRLLFGGSSVPSVAAVTPVSMPPRRTSVNRSTNRRRDTATLPTTAITPVSMHGPASVPGSGTSRPGPSQSMTPVSQIDPGTNSAFGQNAAPYQQNPDPNVTPFQNPAISANIHQSAAVVYPYSVANPVPPQQYIPAPNPNNANQGSVAYGPTLQNQRSHSVPTAVVAPNIASSQGVSHTSTIPQNVSNQQAAPVSSNFMYHQTGYQHQYYQANTHGQNMQAGATIPHQVSNPYSSLPQVPFQPPHAVTTNQYTLPGTQIQAGSPYSSINSAASYQPGSMTQSQGNSSSSNVTDNREQLAQIEYMKQQQTALLQQLEMQNKRQVELERQLNDQKLQHEQNVKRIETENQEKMMKEQQKLIQVQIEKQQKALEKQLEEQKAQQQLFMNQIMMNYSYMQQQYQQNQRVKPEAVNLNTAGFNDVYYQTLNQNQQVSQYQNATFQNQTTNFLPGNTSLPVASAANSTNSVPQNSSVNATQNQVPNLSNYHNQSSLNTNNPIPQNEASNYPSYQSVQGPVSQWTGYQQGSVSVSHNPTLAAPANIGPDINMSEYFATYDPKKPVDHKVLAAMMKQQQEMMRQKQVQEQKRLSELAAQKVPANQSSPVGQNQSNSQSEQQPQNFAQSQTQTSAIGTNVAQTSTNPSGLGQQSSYQSTSIAQTQVQKSTNQSQTFEKNKSQYSESGHLNFQVQSLQAEPLKPTNGSNISAQTSNQTLPKTDSTSANNSGSLDNMSEIDRQLEQMNAEVSRGQNSLEYGTSVTKQSSLPDSSLSNSSSLREVVTENAGQNNVDSSSVMSVTNVKQDVQRNVAETSNFQNCDQSSGDQTLLIKFLPRSNVQRVQPIARTSELYKDAESMSKLKSDLDKLEKHVVNMHKQTLNGPTILQREWSDLESRFLQTVQSSCQLSISNDEMRIPKESNRTSKCYTHNTLLRSGNEDSKMVLVDIDSISELLPRFALFGAVETEPHMKTFWNSVEEFGVTLVVSFQSRNERCPYIPETQGVNVEIGDDFYVRLQNTSVSQYWLQRTLNIFSPSISSNRTVTHLQFLEWPKMTTSEIGEKYPKHGPLISFARTVRHFYNLQESFSSPVVLQSNYDVVQSGMLMLLMQAMQNLDHGIGILDIPMAVNDIRRLFHQAIISSPNELYYLYLCYLHYVYQFMSSRGVQSGYQVINSPSGSGLPKLQPVAKTPVDASNENNSGECASDASSATRGMDGSPLRDLRQLMTADSFSIGAQSGSPKPKHNFDDNQVHIGRNSDPSDPFSSLDAMWKMK